MSADKFLNLMRMQSNLSNNGRAVTALGTVIAFDQINYYAQVELYPADPSDPTSQPTVSGWLPIFSEWVGDGFGFFASPNIGDVVEIHYQEADINNGYIGKRRWTLGNNLSVPSGEMWMVHKSGAYLKMLNTGDLEISAGTPTGNVNIVSNVMVNVTAPAINLGGAISMGNLEAALGGFMNAMAVGIYNSHTHAVGAAPGTTGVPNEQMGSEVLSVNVVGN